MCLTFGVQYTGRQTERKRKNNLENVIYIMYNILYINTIESTFTY